MTTTPGRRRPGLLKTTMTNKSIRIIVDSRQVYSAHGHRCDIQPNDRYLNVIVIVDGVEQGRITGYMAEAAFPVVCEKLSIDTGTDETPVLDVLDAA